MRELRHVLLVALVLALVAAVLATARQPRAYGAQGSVLLSPQVFLDPTATDVLPSLGDTVVAVGTTPAVLDEAGSLYVDRAPDLQAATTRRAQATETWLRDHLVLTRVGTSSVIDVTASAPTQPDAVDLAAAELDALRRFAATARTGVPHGGPRSGIRLLLVTPSTGRGTVSPTPVRNAVVALIVAALLGGAAAFVLARQRRRSGPRRLAADLGLLWLGTAPPDRAGGVVRRLLEGVEAALPCPGHVALVSGTVPEEAIAGVADGAVRSLNETTTRAVLLDGARGARAMARRLLPAFRTSGRPADERVASVVVGDPGALAAPSDTQAHDAPLGIAEQAGSADGAWSGYDFVVVSGPSVPPAGDARALLPAVRCLVLVVSGAPSREHVAALSALADAPGASAAVVGVIGVEDERG